jgi:hypothetical protein
MKKLLISTAFVALGLAFAGQASAQTVTGTVNLTGSVGVACRVVGGGTLNGSTFGSTIALGELANVATGTLRTIPTTNVGDGAGANNFQVNCTGSTVTAAISRTLLETSGAAPAGYASKIDYVAAATVLLSTGSLTVDTDAATAPPASTTSGARVRVAPNNIVITVSDFVAKPDDVPTPAASALLVAGNYSGAVTLTLTPTT